MQPAKPNFGPSAEPDAELWTDKAVVDEELDTPRLKRLPR
jgi:hypothetical protein